MAGSFRVNVADLAEARRRFGTAVKQQAGLDPSDDMRALPGSLHEHARFLGL